MRIICDAVITELIKNTNKQRVSLNYRENLQLVRLVFNENEAIGAILTLVTSVLSIVSRKRGALKGSAER